MREGLGRMAVVLGVALAGAASAASIQGKVKVPGGKVIEDSVVWVAPIPGKTFRAPQQPALLDQVRKRFTPHVLVIQQGQKVLFPNSDLVRHNVFSPSVVHRFNLGIYPPGATKAQVFDEVGVIALLCALHPEMSAYVVVVGTPWFAKVGPDGRYQIPGIPPGRYELVAWHEGLPEVHATVQVKAAGAEQDFVLHKGE